MSYSEVRGSDEFKSITLILLTVFRLRTRRLWAITTQIFGDKFICESPRCNMLSLCLIKWVMNGSLHKKLFFKTFPSELVQTSPPMFLLLISLSPGVMSSFSPRYPRILWAKLSRIHSPAAITAQPGQLLTWEIHTHLDTHIKHTIKLL